MVKPTNVPHATLADLGLKTTDATPPELLATLEEYLKPFAARIGPEKGAPDLSMTHGTCRCLKCGEWLDGLLLGTFQWGLAHGEGSCAGCGWPARAYHYLKNQRGEPLLEPPGRLSVVLQYHPDFVEEKIDEGQAAGG